MLQTISWTDFYQSFITIKDSVPSYRLGQHFINTFIKDETDPDLDGLWDKTDSVAAEHCFEIIKKYQWDVQKLPIINIGENNDTIRI